MGTRYCDEKNVWIASYSKRHPITRLPKSLTRLCKTQAEAKRTYNELVILVNEKLKRSLVPRWEDAIDAYIQSKKLASCEETTLDGIRSSLNANTSAWNGRFIDTITAHEIRGLVLELGNKRKPSHLAFVFRQIKGVFSDAVEKGQIVKNPCPRIKLKKGEKIKNVLTEVQVKTLLNKARELDSEWYLHWLMAVYTGMRNGELYALTWDKVDLDRRRILVDRSWNSKSGFKSTKSGDDRIVEIAPSLATTLREHKMVSCGDPYVLPRSRNWEKGEQARFLRMFLEGLGLPSVRFHDLRASWATIMLGKGIEPIKVMKMGGWKNLKTMQIYVRQAGVDIKGITNDLELHSSKPVAEVLRLSVTRRAK